MKAITIFTPTYNRAHTLPRLYESLKKQTDKSFEWLIVDDGSVDNTKDLVQKWKCEKVIKINYIYQENGGKMRAWNAGVLNCRTDLFMCVDSDDYITDDSIELVATKYKNCNNASVSGIIAYKGKTANEKLTECNFRSKENCSTLYDIYKNGFVGDAAIIYKTEILREYLFPEIEGEKFITESYIFYQIDLKYKLCILEEIIMICEYLSDGYSRRQNKVFLENPRGYALYYNLMVKLSKGFFEKFKYSIGYVCCVINGKIKKGFKNSNNKFLYLVAWPFGLMLLVYRKWFKRG